MSEMQVQMDDQSLLGLVTSGDCARLTAEQKLNYYKARCDAAGLDPRCQPFEFITFQGRQILYARKECSNQLASKHGVICEILTQVTEEGIRTVVVRSKTKDGRQTDEIGCVTVANLKGNDLCNALMKAVTKAKRRAILSICGLGLIDELEVDTLPGVRVSGTHKIEGGDTIDYTSEDDYELVTPSKPVDIAVQPDPEIEIQEMPTTWQDVVCHVKSTVEGKKLGEIEEATLEKMFNTYKPKPPYSNADLYLKNGLVNWKKDQISKSVNV